MANDAPITTEPVTVLDPLEEVLQQVTEHTVKINHLEGTMADVARAVTDLGDVMQAGFVEIRGVAAHASPGGARVDGGDDWRRVIGERLDELEGATTRASRKQTIMLLLLALQLSLAALGLAVATDLVGGEKVSESFEFAPPAPASVAPPPPAVPAPDLVAPAARESEKALKAKRRRH